MSDTTLSIVVVLLMLPLWPLLMRDRIRGLCYATFLCVTMPTYCRIETGGVIPQITIYRALLVILLAFWFREKSLNRLGHSPMPCKNQFRSYLFICFISVLGAYDLVVSLKSWLDIALEIGIFYLISTSFVRNKEDAVRVLRAAWIGMTVVAVLATIEKYTNYGAMRIFPAFVAAEVFSRDVIGTFPHRILLGTAMAMGWPLAVAMSRISSGRGSTRVMIWGSAGMMLAACYFAMSRGPWLAAGGAAMVMALLGSKNLRMPLIVLGVAGAIGLATHPGVLETFTGKAESTMDTDSFKGGTFMYRLELWKIAAHEIMKTPWRLFFGYGPGAGEVVQFEWELSYRDHGRMVTSWDNHFAYDLFQSGICGLAATLVFYFGVALYIFRRWRDSVQPDRDLLACVLATLSALLFMRTNVLIFAKQLDFLFVITASAGYAICGSYRSDLSEQQIEEELEILAQDEQTSGVYLHPRA